MRLGQTLQRSQIPFPSSTTRTWRRRRRPDGKLAIKGHAFDSLVLPEDVELPAPAAAVVEQFRQQGGGCSTGPWEPAKLSSPSLVERLQAGVSDLARVAVHRAGAVRARRPLDRAGGQRRPDGLRRVARWPVLPARGRSWTRPTAHPGGRNPGPRPDSLSLGARQALLLVRRRGRAIIAAASGMRGMGEPYQRIGRVSGAMLPPPPQWRGFERVMPTRVLSRRHGLWSRDAKWCSSFPGERNGSTARTCHAKTSFSTHDI